MSKPRHRPAQIVGLIFCLAAGLAGCASDGPSRGTARSPAPVAVAQGTRIALVIGNDDYPDLPLRQAVGDAKAVRDVLHDKLGFQVLYYTNADKAQMNAAMREFAAALKQSPGSIGLFYYAGHGGVANNANYLWPARVSIQSEAELMNRGYEADIALGTLQDEKARFSVVILDTCRNEPGRGSPQSDGLLGKQVQGIGQILAYSANKGERAGDGVYTKYLVAELTQHGSLLDALRRTQDAVAVETHQIQKPWVSYGPLVGELCLVDCKPPPDPATEQAQQQARQAKEDKDKLALELEKLKRENEALRQAQAAPVIPPKLSPPKQLPAPPPAQAPVVTTPTEPAQARLLPVGPFGIQMVALPGGTFQMGCGPKDGECRHDEKPRHEVTIKPFAIGQTEVTQAQWKAVMGGNPSINNQCGDDCPVEEVSWNDVQDFIARLNEKYPGQNYRLPTEAEWEYACRAGQESHCGGDDPYLVDWLARIIHLPVEGKQANAFGLYDMSGYVWEWTCSAYADHYGNDRETGCPATAQYRVLRRGGWFGSMDSFPRSGREPDDRNGDAGFRLALGPTGSGQ